MGIGTGRVAGAWIRLLMSSSLGSITGSRACRSEKEAVHESGAWGRPHPRSGWNVCQRGESLGEIAVSPPSAGGSPDPVAATRDPEVIQAWSLARI